MLPANDSLVESVTWPITVLTWAFIASELPKSRLIKITNKCRSVTNSSEMIAKNPESGFKMAAELQKTIF